MLFAVSYRIPGRSITAAPIRARSHGAPQATSRPAAVTAGETLALARGERSSLLGRPALEVGADADFLLIPTNSPALGLGELDAGLVYAASGAAVDSTVVAGRVLMQSGRVEGADEVLARTRERAMGLGLV